MDRVGEQSVRSEEWEELFYHKYMPVARTVAGRILYPSGTQEDIEELALEAVYEAMENIGKYDEARGSMETYVRIIAKSRALTYRKKQERYRTVPLEGTLELWIEDEDTAELKDLVRRVIGQLRPREQILFTLRFLYHMTPEEIARREACSRRAVDSRLTRLRKKLVKVFRDHGVEVGGYE